MFLRRIGSTTQRPNWKTVASEFVLVIFGVLIALQVNTWNTSRIDRQGASNALDRLRSEVALNVAAVDGRMAILDASSEVRRAAMVALQACDGSPEALETLSTAVGHLTGDIVPSFVDNTLRELARQDRYLDLLSNDFRAGLNLYSGRLADERDQLRVNFELMWDQHVIKHPTIGVDVQTAELMSYRFVPNQPLDVLCEDTVFLRQFALTEGWHHSAVARMQRFKGWSEDFLAVIDQEVETFR